jgi:hypothetical protein
VVELDFLVIIMPEDCPIKVFGYRRYLGSPAIVIPEDRSRESTKRVYLSISVPLNPFTLSLSKCGR